MATGMKIGAIAPWFGGKRRLADRIVEVLGPHRQYFEPFCGSCAVLLAKPPAGHETVNDLHGGLVCLARVLADEIGAVDLYNRLQKTLFAEDLLREAQLRLEHWNHEPAWWLLDAKHGEYPRLRRSDANMVEFAYWFFILSWFSRNGTAGTLRTDWQLAVRWTPGGGSPTVRFRSAVDSIPAWHERLRNVVILRRDAFQVLERCADEPGTAIYCDPPYVLGGAREGGERYRHDFAAPADEDALPLFGAAEERPADDHRRLRELLGRFRHARVVVSYYDHPVVRELYRDWTRIDCATQKQLHNQNGGQGGKLAPEILLANGA